MYVKLFGSILDSSIWQEDHATVRLWISLLAMADEYGIVHASRSGLARRAGLTVTECDHGLAVLESPDSDSRDGTDGRRIEKVTGGWLLLNYQKYREIRSHKQVADAIRQRRHRKSISLSPRTQHDPSPPKVTSHDVTTEAEAEAEAEAGGGAPPPASDMSHLVPVSPLLVTGSERARAMERLTTEGASALAALLRTAPNPEGVVGEVNMILDGGRSGTPTDPAAVSLALADLVANGRGFGASALRAYVTRAAQGPSTPTEQGVWDALIAKAEREEQSHAAG